MMKRTINTSTLDLAAREWAAEFLRPTVFSTADPDIPVSGRGLVMRNFYNARFKDEFDYLLPKFRKQLGKDSLKEFNDLAEEMFEPRSEETLKELLEEWLAITPEGKHVEGAVGRVEVGRRIVGTALINVETPDSVKSRKARIKRGLEQGKRITHEKIVDHTWPVYAGEAEERESGNPVVDVLPDRGSMIDLREEA